MKKENTKNNGLYSSCFEKDSCGFGLIANMDNKPSHWVIQTSIQALQRLTHRGAIADDGKTSDGCGLLIKKPDLFCKKVAKSMGISIENSYCFGTVFLNKDPKEQKKAKETLLFQLRKQGLVVEGWRKVPINKKVCGKEALKNMPDIQQIIVTADKKILENDFEKKLYVARIQSEKILFEDDTFYISSLSSRVISYKGLIISDNIKEFYSDLCDKDMKSSLCVFHQRFSTNTMPQWKLAQPFRYLAHNGEINTIQGNRHWYFARRKKLKIDALPELEKLHPLVSERDSDSCTLDNMLELLLAGDMGIFRAMRTLMPPAWQNNQDIDNDLKATYEYHSMHMEPWDGPAGIVLTDGRYAACVLDRNGLRPARYVITSDRHITLASEIGVYDYKDEDVLKKGRLAPGQMLAVDTENGELLLTEDIDKILKDRHPYHEWLNKYSIEINGYNQSKEIPLNFDNDTLNIYKKLFSVSFEEEKEMIAPLAEIGQEATGSMGDDTPMPVMSKKNRSIYDYFRQQFAQVTNPPIDSLRENSVMSLEVCFGKERNLFEESSKHADRLIIKSPILDRQTYEEILTSKNKKYSSDKINLNFDDSIDLEEAINTICDRAVRSVKKGNILIILSDKKIGKNQLTIPAAMAVGAIHHRLIEVGLRCDCNLIIETASARNPHNFAVLLGYGATAVYPYLSFEILHEMINRNNLNKNCYPLYVKNYVNGINKGILKIMSKMGISCISSYRGAQLFEIVGLNEDVINLCFKNSFKRISGSSFEDIELDLSENRDLAWDINKKIKTGGLLKYMHDEEFHDYNPDVVKALQECSMTGRYDDYKKFSDLVNNRNPSFLRDLLKLKSLKKPIPLSKVESIDKILKRFDTAGMSLGALSPEAHESLAIAMNTIGGRSNSGEGGEDKKRFQSNKNSKIKQVASGRFGVTPHYLVNAEVIQIKIAQGAKPGEGGQLPGHKVNDMIAELRFSVPGVTLISPPPHHDIYSIEDLAQLIFDLKQINNKALISVKLVSQAGVGTIAAGVTKAYADLITISGYDGGTGASPLTSVKYAGSPWELGISETHQTLMRNNLRHKVRLQTDGGLKTGLDIIKGAILGAESFGFGTSVMITLGCKYLRICHLNNCATGVATQNKILRMKHFSGTPERVINYLRFVAKDVREILASLGYSSINQIIGKTELLKEAKGITKKHKKLNLKSLLVKASNSSERYCTTKSNDPFDKASLAKKILRDTMPYITKRKKGEFSYNIKNYNRSIGANISGVIAKLYGNYGLSKTPITLNLNGTAGQSLGAWNAGGLNIILTGDSNDYVGKGMAAGKITLKTSSALKAKADEMIIIGNTCLYGATGGKLYAEGIAGERFAVRNSGCTTVIEGSGDHTCEYMTGGSVIVLGKTGNNFGAGMTGGLAFVYDEQKLFKNKINNQSVEIRSLNDKKLKNHQNYLLKLIKEHFKETKSLKAKFIIDNFNECLKKFNIVKPKDANFINLLNILIKAA
ncbi:MAG: glutamate synthase large subunit [Pseudomonadota bacterium]|nr:glutamate synthase large subunit [Pseudomonadota bacterium]